MSKAIGGNGSSLAVLRSDRVQRDRNCRGIGGVLLSGRSSSHFREAPEQILITFLVCLGVHFPLDVREGIEEQLAKVGLSDGVPAMDALVNKLFEEVAEKEIDGVRGREIVDVGKERGGDGLVIFRTLGFQAIQVMRAKRIVTAGSKHATTMAASVNVLTLLIGLGIDRNWK